MDVSRAKATVESDLIRILRDIEVDVGVLKMSRQLKAALVDSVLAEVPLLGQEQAWSEESAILNKAANICE